MAVYGRRDIHCNKHDLVIAVSKLSLYSHDWKVYLLISLLVERESLISWPSYFATIDRLVCPFLPGISTVPWPDFLQTS
jgi:hypothetical protein